MKDFIKKYWEISLIVILIFADCSLWWVLQNELPTNYVTIVFLNTRGKGEAIYIESSTHNKILIDGGPMHSLLPELSKVLPFYARSIDTFILTDSNPNNFAGMLDVLPVYHFARIINLDISELIPPESASLKSSTSISSPFAQFQNLIQAQRIPVIVAEQEMILHIGGGADIKILPADQASSSKNSSLHVELTYGSTTVMFTGKDDLVDMLTTFHISTSTIQENKTAVVALSTVGITISYK